ncbi:MAG TPA: hypothetical protein VFW63_02680 [Acidimicrobiales bacterium]|nr:hypothetical protein [Acidimicrobiales bacterium]
MAGAGAGLAAFGIGYCSSQVGVGRSEEGMGTASELLLPASELETTLAVLAVHNSIELRVTHDVQLFGETRPVYTDVYPAEVPGFVELRLEDVPDIDVAEGGGRRGGDRVTVTIPRDGVFVQERVEQLREPVRFTVEDGRLVEGEGLPVEPGTRVFLADGEHTTGAFEFDPEGAESALTKLADAVTLGLTGLSAGTSEDILRIAQLATLNPACLRAADEAVGFDELVGGGIVDHLVAEGIDPADIDLRFTGEYPPYDEIPDETGATFAGARREVEEALAGDNQKVIDLAADCDADSVVEPSSVLTLTAERPGTGGGPTG